MSLANTAVIGAARPEVVRPDREQTPRRRLQAVPKAAPRRRPKVAYAIVAFGGAVAIAVAQMSLSVLTTQSSYELAQLNQDKHTATLQAQELSDEVAGLSSPQYLAANAAGLGMVIDSGASASLRLSDGKIMGVATPAGSASTVDAKGRGAVGNALLEKRPLTTDPESTLEGKKEEPKKPADAEKPEKAELPPPVTEGLPSPTTH